MPPLLNYRLKTIDLTPLHHCSHLRGLFLQENRLQNLSLTPLKHCQKLRALYLSDNRLRHVDLTPLRHCSKLREIHLWGNRLTSVDLSPLFGCSELSLLVIDTEVVLTVDHTLKTSEQIPKAITKVFPRIRWTNNE